VKIMRIALLAAAASLLAAPAAGAAHRAGGHVSLVAYSTPNVAFGKLISAFQATPAGKDVSFDQSYGAAESQVKAVVAGLPADIVDFSLADNVNDLVKAELVDRSWSQNRYGGIVTRSVVVFVVRNANPKHIKTWDDLIKPGVDVVAANPFTSGGARWNVLAAYGSQLREGRKPGAATDYLLKLFQHVVSQDSSGRNALNTFLSGKGDVLLTYENEAKLAQAQGKPVYYVIPKATIRIENPLAILKKSQSNPAVQAFYKFLYSPQGQEIWAQQGYRPVDLKVYDRHKADFPIRPQLFTIAYLGGWSKVTPQFFDPQNGIMARIERSLGVSTG
jgi:sulfate/thiosulfate transport system substrate-binding protein